VGDHFKLGSRTSIVDLDVLAPHDAAAALPDWPEVKPRTPFKKARTYLS